MNFIFRFVLINYLLHVSCYNRIYGGMVSIAAFQAVVPGSMPKGRNCLKKIKYVVASGRGSTRSRGTNCKFPNRKLPISRNILKLCLVW